MENEQNSQVQNENVTDDLRNSNKEHSIQKENMREALLPLYASLFKNVEEFQYDKVCFVAQWGDKFPTQPNNGLMFVGRAVNGWDDADNAEDALKQLDRFDKIFWADDYCNSSPFGRMIRNVTCHFYSSDNWFAYPAWSNVCKISPSKGGNPNNALYYAQLEDCKKILETEIRILSPKVVVFLTRYDWANDFLSYLNGGQLPTSIAKESWSGYESQLFEIGDVAYILSEHPQTKEEGTHVDSLVKLISRYM